MIDRLVILLKDFGFEVQETSYKHLMESEEFSYLGSIDLPDNEVANILQHFPHLFVVHRKIRPQYGVLFIIVKEKGEDIPTQARYIYGKYFPDKIVVVSRDDSTNIYAKWLHSSAKPEPFESFFNNLTNIDI